MPRGVCKTHKPQSQHLLIPISSLSDLHAWMFQEVDQRSCWIRCKTPLETSNNRWNRARAISFGCCLVHPRVDWEADDSILFGRQFGGEPETVVDLWHSSCMGRKQTHQARRPGWQMRDNFPRIVQVIRNVPRLVSIGSLAGRVAFLLPMTSSIFSGCESGCHASDREYSFLAAVCSRSIDLSDITG